MLKTLRAPSIWDSLTACIQIVLDDGRNHVITKHDYQISANQSPEIGSAPVVVDASKSFSASSISIDLIIPLTLFWNNIYLSASFIPLTIIFWAISN